MPTALDKFLKEKNWKTAHFARIVGAHRTTISKLRSGKGFTSAEIAMCIEVISDGKVPAKTLTRSTK